MLMSSACRSEVRAVIFASIVIKSKCIKASEFNTQQLVAHQRQPHQAGEDHRRGAADQLGRQVLEVIGGRDDIGCGVGGQGGDNDQRHGQGYPARALDVADQAHRVGDSDPHQFYRGGSHHHPQGGEQEHGQRQTEDLPEDLVLLAFRVAAEVGNVQRQRGPETDHGGEPGTEVTDHAGALGPLGRLRQQLGHRHVRQRPHQQADADRHQQWR